MTSRVEKKSSEPRRPEERHLRLLDRARSQLGPDGEDLRDWFETYARQHRDRLAHDLWIVDEHLEPGAKILELGSVPLLLTAALTASGYAVQGLDVAPERFASSIADLRLDVARCDLETEPLPFADGTFDALLLNELLEHLRIDLLFSLREARRVLRPGGRLLLSTPNLRSFRGLRNLLLHGQGHAVSGGVYAQWQKLERLGHMGHVREYTVREASDLLEHIGFRIEHVIHRGGHGRGPVGLLERLLPSWRPFFSLVARRDEDSADEPPSPP